MSGKAWNPPGDRRDGERGLMFHLVILCLCISIENSFYQLLPSNRSENDHLYSNLSNSESYFTGGRELIECRIDLYHPLLVKGLTGLLRLYFLSGVRFCYTYSVSQ